MAIEDVVPDDKTIRLPRIFYALPFSICAGVFVWGVDSIGGNVFPDITQSMFMEGLNLPFYGVTLWLIACSLGVVFFGTLLYLVEQVWYTEEHFHRHHGRGYVMWSLGLCALSLLGIITFAIWWSVLFALKDQVGSSDINSFLFAHDIVIACIFFLFIVVDSLFFLAADKAEKTIETSDKIRKRLQGPEIERHLKHAKHVKILTKAQIFLVDIPVIFGAAANIAFTKILLARPDFAADTGQLYLSGVAAGFVVAHIIVSQLVFALLNGFSGLLFSESED
jgi:hypothetical protein